MFTFVSTRRGGRSFCWHIRPAAHGNCCRDVVPTATTTSSGVPVRQPRCVPTVGRPARLQYGDSPPHTTCDRGGAMGSHVLRAVPGRNLRPASAQYGPWLARGQGPFARTVHGARGADAGRPSDSLRFHQASITAAAWQFTQSTLAAIVAAEDHPGLAALSPRLEGTPELRGYPPFGPGVAAGNQPRSGAPGAWIMCMEDVRPCCAPARPVSGRTRGKRLLLDMAGGTMRAWPFRAFDD